MKTLVIEPRGEPPKELPPYIRRAFAVGRFTVTITVDPGAFERGCVTQTTIQWSPDIPKPGQLSAKKIGLYQQRRNVVFQEIADLLGERILVADL